MTGYDAPSAYGGRDEEALKSRQRADQRATSKDVRAETPQCAKAAARSNSPRTGKAEEFAQLARELGEALERQTATTEVLQVINSSHGDLQPVFQTMLANAVRLCQATFGVLWLAEGDRFRSVASDHFAVLLGKSGPGAVVTGDLIHSPLQARYPELSCKPDYDRQQAARTRRAFLERFCDSGTLCCTAHFPSPSVGHIARWGDGFRCETVEATAR